MNISLDYDGTASRDIPTFAAFIDMMKAQGHMVYIVTMRTPGEALLIPWALTSRAQVIATSRKAKAKFCFDLKISIDVWIDDQPHFVYTDALPVELEDERNTEN